MTTLIVVYLIIGFFISLVTLVVDEMYIYHNPNSDKVPLWVICTICPFWLVYFIVGLFVAIISTWREG